MQVCLYSLDLTSMKGTFRQSDRTSKTFFFFFSSKTSFEGQHKVTLSNFNVYIYAMAYFPSIYQLNLSFVVLSIKKK